MVILPVQTNSLVVEGVTLRDGHAEVTISGVASGPVHFYASRTFELHDAFLLNSAGRFPIYQIYLPSSPAGYYLWVKDDNGFCAESFAFWNETASMSDVNLLGTKIRDILMGHEKLLNAALQRFHEDGTFKTWMYGIECAPDKWPAVVVTNPSWTSQWYTLGFGKRRYYSFTIGVCILSNDIENELPVAVECARAVHSILDMPNYNDIVLDNGLTVGGCGVTTGDVRLVPVSDNAQVSIATLVFKGDCFVADTGT